MSLSDLGHFTMSYKATFLSTFLLTVIFDLTVAVEVGLMVAAVFFLYRMNTLTRLIPETLPEGTSKKIEAWLMEGALFFGSVSKLEIVMDPKHINVPGSPDVIIFDFSELLSIDNSAMELIEAFHRNLVKHNKVLIISGASDHPLRQIQRMGMDKSLGKFMVADLKTAIALAEETVKEMENPKKVEFVE